MLKILQKIKSKGCARSCKTCAKSCKKGDFVLFVSSQFLVFTTTTSKKYLINILPGKKLASYIIY
jgi:hypothetical protein